MKLYTKTGDKGRTSLLGGKKVGKHELQIEAYGTIDELNAYVGHLSDHGEIGAHLTDQLICIQVKLFNLGSILASEQDFKGFELPQITVKDVEQLEQWIDAFDAELPVLKNFILPRGHQAISTAHICRTICRRAERRLSSLHQKQGLDENILAFVNRLSDYFFILARKIAHDLDVPETPWAPEA